MPNRLWGVLIVSDVRLYRDGLVAFLSEDPRLGALGACSDSASSLEALRTHRYAAVCVDCGMKGAFCLAQRLIAEGYTVVLLGMESDAAVVIDWLEAGVAGYVCKEASVDELIRAVESAVNQEVVCSREVARMLHRRVTNINPPPRVAVDSTRLTNRENEIASLLELGWGNKRIASHLNIAVSTAKNHVHNILDKLGVSTRAEAAAMLRQLNSASRGTDVSAAPF